MKLKVIKDFDGNSMGVFPTFAKGTVFEFVGVDPDTKHWCPTITSGGHGFWTPAEYLDGLTLKKDYNPTSLTVSKGEILEVLEETFGWYYVRTSSGNTGYVIDEVIEIHS